MRTIATLLLLLVVPIAMASEHNIDDKAALTAFVDGIMAASLKEHNVAGAVVGITRGDEVLMLKGYGYSDVAGQVPVDPGKTLFRIGSVTKPFVWLAIMQLVEQDKVSLDEDINTYLGEVQVPDSFPEAVTLRDLMTHTPGFEDLVLGLFAREADALRPLTELLTEEMPLRVRPPFTRASYSNHGVAMAGLIVEQVTGQDWDTYVRENILDPLDMPQATMKQPVPEHLEGDLSLGYRYAFGQFEEEPFEFVPAAPAGGASAAAADMLAFARFFLAAGNDTVLSRANRDRMMTRLFEPRPDMNGVAHGFYEFSSHGHRILGHGGDTIWFHSELALMPDDNLAWFISTNSANGGEVRSAFTGGMMDRYFPVPPLQPLPEAERTDRARLAGEYGGIRHSHSDPTRLIKLMGTITIQPDLASDAILMTSPLDPGNPLYLVEIAPGLFQHREGGFRIGFELPANEGPATYLYLDNAPIITFERLTGTDSAALNNTILALTALTFGWALVAWMIQYFRSPVWREPAEQHFRLAGWTTALVIFVFIITVATVISDQRAVVFGPEGLDTVTALAWLIVVLVLGVALLAVRVFREPRIGRGAGLRALWVALVGLSFGWFLDHWQFL